MKRIREFLESIVFAGLKPSGQAGPQRSFKWLGPLSGPVERLLSGGPAPTDPLYLTNRTPAQKFRSWSLIAVPCVIVLGVIGFMLSSYLEPPEGKPIKEATPAEIAAHLLPNMDKDLKLSPSSDVQVVDVKVENAQLIGTLKNTGTRDINLADVNFNLTDAEGSQVGTANAVVEKIPASATRTFQVPLRQRNAAFALVGEISSR
jgi:hypothetical protein